MTRKWVTAIEDHLASEPMSLIPGAINANLLVLLSGNPHYIQTHHSLVCGQHTQGCNFQLALQLKRCDHFRQ